MISVEEAKALLMSKVYRLPAEGKPLRSGGYAAKEVFAPHDHPLFDCSAVDGYAFAFDADVKEWSVVGEVPAGRVFSGELKPGECLRIFTGALVPASADTVVMQEFVQREGDRVTHTDVKLKAGGNVRKKGEQVRAGDRLLEAGARLDAVAIGLLASCGIREVAQYVTPRVAVIVTGDEFSADATPAPGRIFSSNDVMLLAALTEQGIHGELLHAKDSTDALLGAFGKASVNADLVITTGGASVGDHDLIKPVLEAMGATIHFHGVAQKPGKPMLFTSIGEKPIVALPGNPRAVMILFWEFVLPFLRAMQGARDPWLRTEHLPIMHAVTLKGDRAEFRAAQVKDGRVTLLADEGSHMLRSLVDADVLAYFPATMRTVNTNETVEVHHLPR
ncbi:MAG: molybdopterin molybdotransferase MoeA [Flavobacteriales bacterium]|nr:molybdopterin molybdotransferase MoeA [Flavobacteriales bacterium]